MDNNEVEFNEMDEAAAECFRLFEVAVSEELSMVETFKENDIERLYKLIFANLDDIEDLDMALDTLEYRVMLGQDLRQRLKYQIHLTKKDIFEENLINIYLLYNVAALGVWLTSPNAVEFLKRFVVVGIIGFVSYDLNARYFASEGRKQKAKITLEEIENYLGTSRYDINNINKFRDMYIEMLEVELCKLRDITLDIDNDKNRNTMNKWLVELELDYLLEKPMIRKRIK